MGVWGVKGGGDIPHHLSSFHSLAYPSLPLLSQVQGSEFVRRPQGHIPVRGNSYTAGPALETARQPPGEACTTESCDMYH